MGSLNMINLSSIRNIKNMKPLWTSLMLTLLVSFSTPSLGENEQKVWLTSVCYQFNLAVWDKRNQGNYTAKYTVTSSDGRVFVAERFVSEDSNTAEVIFPDDFLEKRTNLKAWINCGNGERYTWAIYANDVLMDSGTIGLTRNKRSAPRK
jgi:hypothetical protein